MTTYIIKSSVSLLLMFGIYWFLLRKEKLFVFNRFFLISSIIFSLAVPLISIPVNFYDAPQLSDFIPSHDYVIQEAGTTNEMIPGYESISQPDAGKQLSPVNIQEILLSLYITVVILFLIRFMRNIYILIRRSRLYEKVSFKGYSIILTDDNKGPYCFFSTIFLNREDYLNGRIDKELFNHELEHVRQAHTIDIILIELVKIFYWFNPVHLLYDRAVRLNHEYLADSGVIGNNYDIKGYTDKLLSFITGRSNMSLTSGLNHSFTKKRLLMMTKTRSGRLIYGVKFAIILCLVSVFFLLLSFEESVGQVSALKTSEPETVQMQNTVRGIVITEDGKPLAFARVSTTQSGNTQYTTSTGFDGHFSIDGLSSGTPILITYQGFKGETIKADFTSEMIVRLVRDPDYKGKIMVPEILNVKFRNSDFTSANALVVINGVITDFKANLKVNPGEIKSFNILTGKEATDKYRDKGKDGVVEIILYGNNTGSSSKKPFNSIASDTSKYIKYLSINHITNKGEVIDIPVSNLQYVSVWTYHDIDNTDKKELRSIGIMTRDYFKVKGKVVRENGKPLPGVKITVTDNPVAETSDKEGRFLIKDVREDALLEFSLPGYKPYYLSTKFEVAFNEEMTIKLEKD